MSQWGEARWFDGIKIVPVIRTRSLFAPAQPADMIEQIEVLSVSAATAPRNVVAQRVREEWTGKSYGQWLKLPSGPRWPEPLTDAETIRKIARMSLEHIRAMCGNPDPSEACRLILKRAQQALDDLGKG